MAKVTVTAEDIKGMTKADYLRLRTCTKCGTPLSYRVEEGGGFRMVSGCGCLTSAPERPHDADSMASYISGQSEKVQGRILRELATPPKPAEDPAQQVEDAAPVADPPEVEEAPQPEGVTPSNPKRVREAKPAPEPETEATPEE